jgi:membrane-associated protease RseP (regulator of RpoE activity)
VHEFGHFFIARCFNVKVLTFSFGFGKVIARIKDKQGTEYSWSLFPLGGYVTMATTKDANFDSKDMPHALDQQSLLARCSIVLAGPAFNFLFACICIWIVLMYGHAIAPFIALKLAIFKTLETIRQTSLLFLQLFTGKLNFSYLSGPIGIAQAASWTAQQGLVQYLGFLALVSISLGVVNLLPIPMLDGGHLLFYFIEAILQKPLSDKIQEVALKIGVSILMIFMFFAFSNDIARWV